MANKFYRSVKYPDLTVYVTNSLVAQFRNTYFTTGNSTIQTALISAVGVEEIARPEDWQPPVTPDLTIVSPGAGDISNGSALLTFTVSNGTVEARFGSAAYAAVENEDALSTISGWSAASDGEVVLSVKVTDEFGATTTETVTFTRDTDAPGLTIAAPSDNGYVRNASVLTFTVDETATVEAKVGSAAYVTVTTGAAFSTLSGFSSAGQGAIVLSVKATDEAGNTATTTLSLTKDTVAPVVAITNPADEAIVDGTEQLTFTKNEGTATAKVGSGTYTAVTTTNLISSLNGWAGISEDAEFTLSLKVVDQAGNETVETLTLTKNATP
jgi:hypothetical protein